MHRCAPLFALLAASLAAAHTGPTEVTSVRALPGGEWVLGTTFGLVTRHSAQAPWDVICSEAIGYDEKYTPVVHLNGDGALFVGSLENLFVSRDGGCSWSEVPGFAARGVTSMVSAPGRADVLFATSGRFSAANGLFRSDDSGATFATTVHQRVETFYSAARFAPSDPLRLWVSAWYFSPEDAWLFRSDDGGQSFIEVHPSLPAKSGFALSAVHPVNKDVLLATAYDAGTTEYLLLYSEDGGATFAAVAKDVRPFAEVAFSADGASAWASSDRLFVSADGGKTFTLSPLPKASWCAAWVDGAAYICASHRLESQALLREDANGERSVVLAFAEVRGLLECPEGSAVREVCGPLWSSLALALGVDAGTPVDGGTTADGGQQPAPEPRPEPTGCGCSQGGGSAHLLWFLAALLLLKRRAASRTLVAVAFALALSGCPAPTPCEGAGCTANPCDPNPCTDPARSRCVVDLGKAKCFAPPEVCSPNPCVQPNRSVCSGETGAPVCACDPGYELRGDTCGKVVDCSAQHEDGDVYEPDECPALARDIGISGAQEEAHTLSPAGDQDWFKLDALEGRAYRFQVVAEASTPVQVDLYRGDPPIAVGSTHQSADRVDFAIKAQAGTHFLRVRRSDAANGGDAYAISIGDLGPDDYADSPAAAAQVTLPFQGAGAFQFNGDVDVVATPVTGGRAYAFVAAAAAGELRLDLFDAATGAAVSSRLGPTASLTTRASTDGVRWAAVADPSSAFGGTWTLEVLDLGPDDHGDVSSEATPLGACTPPGELFSIDRAGDVDMFSFQAAEGRIYRVGCAPQSLTDCAVELSSADGALVASDVDGGPAIVAHEVAAAGTFLVRVYSGLAAQGSYRLCLEDLGPDDHGDDPTRATLLGMPMMSASGSGNIETPGDHDFLTFTADADHVYRITCTRAGLGDCNVRVFNAAGIPVAQDTDGGDGFLLHEFNGGGDFHVEVYGGTGQMGAYSWKVEDLWHDDHGDNAPTASTMSANGALVGGEIQTWVDADFFRWTATANHVYRVSCVRQSLPDCHLRLYDPQEVQVAADVDGQDALILFKVTASGTWALDVRGGQSQVGTYFVKIDDLGEDDYPDTPAGAPLMLANGTPSAGTYESPGDVDVRQVTLAAATTYQATASGTPTVLTLYAPDGVTVLATGVSPLSVTTGGSGAHFLAAKAQVSSLTGTYTVALNP